MQRPLPKAIIVDIDGTIALPNGREQQEWDKVFTDKVNEPVRELVRQYEKASGHAVLIVTARPESCKEKTFDWLQVSGIPFSILLMRSRHNDRPDTEVKKGLYNRYIKHNYDVVFVLDDKNSAVDMWRNELKLPCFQVDRKHQ